jgi:hypothetical protein
MRKEASHFLLALLALLAGALEAGTDLPENLVVDVRLYEARSVRPDFQAMDKLSFFVNTDGTAIGEPQWLATIARQVPDSVIATLATDTASIEGNFARLDVAKRSRHFQMSVDLAEFAATGTFSAKAELALSRGDKPVRGFDRTLELRLGQTYVWSSGDLEISASEYLSHFRDFGDADDRGKLYERLRDFTFFLLVAVTPRLADPAVESAPPVPLSAKDLEIPDLESPLGVSIEGEVELLLSLDDFGTPQAITIVRSSIPEVNPRVVGEAASWRFPEAAGKRGLVTLSLTAKP